MKVREAMTRDVRLAKPDQPIREAAKLMAELDIGVLPVDENDRLVGMITDRDIAVRAVAAGRGADTPIRDVMSGEIKYCYDDQTVDDVTQNMGELRIRRSGAESRQAAGGHPLARRPGDRRNRTRRSGRSARRYFAAGWAAFAGAGKALEGITLRLARL